MTKKLQAYSVFLPRHRLSRKELPNGGREPARWQATMKT